MAAHRHAVARRREPVRDEVRGHVRALGFGGADAFRDSTGGIEGLVADGVTLQLNTLGDADSREAWRAALSASIPEVPVDD